jgi:hypothetical protein
MYALWLEDLDFFGSIGLLEIIALPALQATFQIVFDVQEDP